MDILPRINSHADLVELLAKQVICSKCNLQIIGQPYIRQDAAEEGFGDLICNLCVPQQSNAYKSIDDPWLTITRFGISVCGRSNDPPQKLQVFISSAAASRMRGQIIPIQLDYYEHGSVKKVNDALLHILVLQREHKRLRIMDKSKETYYGKPPQPSFGHPPSGWPQTPPPSGWGSDRGTVRAMSIDSGVIPTFMMESSSAPKPQGGWGK